jgi:maltooligosyltrehalose trehalohydrolase
MPHAAWSARTRRRPTPSPEPPVSLPHRAPLGATWYDDGPTSFLVWAPRAQRVELLLGDPADDADEPAQRVETMSADSDGYHHTVIEGVPPGAAYRYRLHHEGREPVDRPDPASRYQPLGVHGPSAVDDPRFAWTDEGFRAPPLHEQVLYELHVGTFSPEGTFDGVIDRLDALVDLGVTTIELLPVAQFPGARNWGYDGVLPFAVQDSYGGPAGLRRLVDACHARGLAVVLDVVYNHLGPEGNYLADYGPYFSEKYATPWGPSVNVDGEGADAVRRYLVENAVRWVTEFHVDGFRLDAVHAIIDQSATHLLEELAGAVREAGATMGKPIHVIAESDLCDARLMRHPEAGGYGLDAQWADDFHHALHVALTGEQDGYYADYRGLADLPRQLRDRYAFAGRYSPSRGRTVGRPAPDVPYDRFVVCAQNHDQVGNRLAGDRLRDLTDLEGAKLAAAAVLTSPFVPLLFMGEEHADPAPFQFFTSYGDPDVVKGVSEGRRAEFAAFEAWAGRPPEPQDEATFLRSTIDLSLRDKDEHAQIYGLYRELIALRKQLPLLTDPGAPDVEARMVPGREAVLLRRRNRGEQVLIVINADDHEVTVEVGEASGTWRARLDTAEKRWGGRADHLQDHVASGEVLRLHVAPRSTVLLHQEAPR